MVLNAKVVFPVSKNTSQAFFGLSVTDVADQYTSINTLLKGCPAGRVGPDRVEGSTRLDSSEIDGNLQPFRPPTFLSAQTARASVQDISVVSTVFSHTSPVSSSRTAASSKRLKTVNREALGNFLPQFCSEECAVGLESGAEPAWPLLATMVIPTRTRSPSLSMQL